jgi:hypothetical protein
MHAGSPVGGGMVRSAGRDRPQVRGDRGDREQAGEQDQGDAPAVLGQQPSSEWEEDAGGEPGHDGDRQQGPVPSAGLGGGDDDRERCLVQRRRTGQADGGEHSVELADRVHLRPSQDGGHAEDRAGGHQCPSAVAVQPPPHRDRRGGGGQDRQRRRAGDRCGGGVQVGGDRGQQDGEGVEQHPVPDGLG